MAISASLLGAGLLLSAAFTDARWRIIPNRIVLLLTLAGIVARWGDGVPAFLGAMAVAGVIFAAMLLLFHFGLVGGGDVKLLAAASLLSAPADVPRQLFLIALAGGVMALMFLLHRFCFGLHRKISIPGAKDSQPADRAVHSLAANQQNEQMGFQGDGLPYGVAICIGTLASMALSK